MIPLTRAIVPALTVECVGQRFALPQLNLLKLVSLDNERAAAGIEDVGEAKVYRLRGTLLPLVQLDTDGRRFGLVVDRVTIMCPIIERARRKP